MERRILHIDQDSFFVEVARLQHSALKGRPVIIGGMSGRAVVASCSYEARRFGVHSAMPVRMALQLCPEAVVVRCDFDEVSKQSQLITEIIAGAVPVVEKTSIDEHYADLSGLDRHFGSLLFAHELRERIIRETGLPVSFGLSQNKTVSKVATGQAKPNGERNVAAGDERNFLAPLPIGKLPGVGGVRHKQLRGLGLERIGQIQEMPAQLLERVLGQDGRVLWQKANGIDDSPVLQYREQKSIGHERTFEQDTIDMDVLRRRIRKMTADIGFELRKAGKIANTVVVKIRYSDFTTCDKQLRIPYTNLDEPLIRAALETFEKLYTRRVLLRLVGVKVTGLIHGSPQIDLFSDTGGQIRLAQAMDGIKKRFGAAFIQSGA